MVCFSCGQSGHGVSRCPHLDETFPYLLQEWSVERGDGPVMTVSPRTITEHLQSGNIDDFMRNINFGIGVLHVKRQILTYVL